MVKFEISPMLKRPMRNDDLPELGVSTVTKLVEAIEKNQPQEAKELLKYLWQEWKGIHDLYGDWVWAIMDEIALEFGEEAMYRIIKSTMETRRKRRLEAHRKYGLKEAIPQTAEVLRGHRSGREQLGDFTIRDEGDKIVIDLDPCGSGGKMRLKDPVDGSPARTGAPYNLGFVKKAYPWTWSQTGVARYCAHCCINEIIDIEFLGYPIYVHEYPEDPSKPCRWLIYKDPESIPEHYFTRVGKTRPSS